MEEEYDAAALEAALTFVDQFSSASSSPSPYFQEPEQLHLLHPLPQDMLLHEELQGFGEDDAELELLALDALTPDDDDDEIIEVPRVSNDGAIVQAEPQQAIASSQRKKQKEQSQVQTVSAKRTLGKKAGSSSAKKPLKYNPNKARDERKEELIHLRKRVSELETQLNVLKEKRPRITACQLHPNLGTGEEACGTHNDCGQVSQSGGSEQQLVIAGVWQDMANRQCEERIKSERENVRLKQVLENQIKIAKSLERLLKKKSSTKVSRCCPICACL